MSCCGNAWEFAGAGVEGLGWRAADGKVDWGWITQSHACRGTGTLSWRSTEGRYHQRLLSKDHFDNDR